MGVRWTKGTHWVKGSTMNDLLHVLRDFGIWRDQSRAVGGLVAEQSGWSVVAKAEVLLLLLAAEQHPWHGQGLPPW